MTTLINNLTPGDDSELIGSRLGRIDPNNFSNPYRPSTDNDDHSDKPLKMEDGAIIDEPVDEEGNPTGE